MTEAFSSRAYPGCVPAGKDYVIRSFSAADAPALSVYFDQLSSRSRYDRFLGAMDAPSANSLAKLALPSGPKNLVAVRGEGQIIGEARYAFDDAAGAVELALSVADRERGMGIGTAFLKQIEQEAAHAGALTIFGDTLRTNGKMLSLARSGGFRFSHPPEDWTLVRFERNVLDPFWTLPVSHGATAANHDR